MEKLGVGILGPGLIAEKVAATLARMPSVEMRAIASRDKAKAEAFAARFGAKKACGSYEEMLADKTVELVYIATPNPFHHEQCLLCLEHGKHVLCEKPFTMKRAHAEEIFALAKKKGLLAAEALWTRYMPFLKTLQRMVKEEGAIGTLRLVQANIGHDIRNVLRLREPSLGGGALLDLGVYALNFAAAFIDESPSAITTSHTVFETGVDAQNTVVQTYPSGTMAVLSSTMLAPTDKAGMLYGDKGYLLVESINELFRAHRYSADRKFIETLEAPPRISGFEHQFLAAAQAIRDGKTECPELPHSAVLETTGIMENILADWKKA